MSRFAQGIYRLTNPAKYAGNRAPRYRSGWEHAFMRFCDSNENIVQWASEAISIPYRHPLTGRQTIYIPDFFVQYRDKNNRTRAELIEIKPKKQSIIESRASARDRAVIAVNYAKWAAAQKWCQRQGLIFRVITEDDIFRNGSK
jgi:hypothetical protein